MTNDCNQLHCVTRPTLERRGTVGHLISINPNWLTNSPVNGQLLKIKMLNGPAWPPQHGNICATVRSFLCRMERIYFFSTLKANCEKWCNLSMNRWGSTSKFKLAFFKYHLHYQPIMEMFTYFHSISSIQVNAATWFLVLPINMENPYRLSREWYRYIYRFRGTTF